MYQTGWTPLMFAARLGYTRIAKILIEYGPYHNFILGGRKEKLTTMLMMMYYFFLHM